MSDTLEARFKAHLGGMRGGPARAKSLSSERRSEIARLGAAARAKKYARPSLQGSAGETLVLALRTEPDRTFTKPELRRIVRAFGYRLDRNSHRYWHPAIPGWITLPPGRRGILPVPIARELLRPLLDELGKRRS
jgi:hypothetical protein